MKDKIFNLQEGIETVYKKAEIEYLKYKFSSGWSLVGYAKGFDGQDYITTSYSVVFGWYEADNILDGSAINYIESIDIGYNRQNQNGTYTPIFTKWKGIIGLTMGTFKHYS